MATAALCLSGQVRSFGTTRHNISSMILNANPNIQFDILLASAEDAREDVLCRQPNARSCHWVVVPRDLPLLDEAAAGAAAAASRAAVRRANASQGHLGRGYTLVQAMNKQQLCWAELQRRSRYNFYIGTRFDLELTAPLVLAALDLREHLYVAPHANHATGPSAHRPTNLRASVPDFLVVADEARFTVWMTRGPAFEQLFLAPPRPLRGSEGVPERFPMIHAPEAFLARWLYLHGIAHNQTGNNVSVLPGGVTVLLVRDASWPRADCQAASRRWLAVCLGSST